MKPREPSLLERAVPWLLGAAILLAVVMGVSGLLDAQTGTWGPAGLDERRPATRPNVVAAPELPPAAVQVHLCRDADGRELYLDRPCPPGTTGGPVEVVTLEIATGAPDASAPPRASAPASTSASAPAAAAR